MTKSIDELLDELDKIYVPEKISSGVEAYSGGVDAPSFRQGFNTAKTMLLVKFKSLITQREKESVKKLIDVMKDTLLENFHYRAMCGEIKDPDGEVDVHKLFAKYQELEPERVKFAAYVENVKAQIRKDK